ncbi:uncharacterized protein N7469_004025 [Penicillium citrinum]|uniref:Uncharacterized protein n=2 Tax=Penicillium TaxID=5073 RepID=A0A9W9P3W6_PENCI|nr:uncharacterized protein N7469_004025 [Penicillium citrinum]KAJ5234857.1 hypothetical protein N7469_004025 [Penicillium citrinum]KAJ5590479.1 hypothetical protein N7450_004451 [Penicillium hetheringtonii]
MSLKRKASFSAMPSSPFAPASSDWDMTDSSKHLHSRTRKRFRDGRPNDEAVYAKTLRWIFSAQKQQNEAPIDSCDEDMDSEPTSAETVDPRQQSLLRFFQPRTQPTSPFKPSRQALAPRANETAMSQDEIIRREAFERMISVGSTSGSDTMSPGINQMDVNMDMDTDESSEGSNTMASIGAAGWM